MAIIHHVSSHTATLSRSITTRFGSGQLCPNFPNQIHHLIVANVHASLILSGIQLATVALLELSTIHQTIQVSNQFEYLK